MSVREYARIQTFPDEWQFMGAMSDKYKQIGNAVPVNLAWAVGRSLIRLFNDIETVMPTAASDCTEAVREIMLKQQSLVVKKNKVTQTSEVQSNLRQLNLFDDIVTVKKIGNDIPVDSKLLNAGISACILLTI